MRNGFREVSIRFLTPLAIVLAGAGSSIAELPSSKTIYSGTVQVGTPCHLLPAGAGALCIQQSLSVHAKLQFAAKGIRKTVETNADGSYEVRLPRRKYSIQLRAMTVELNGETVTFDPSRFRLIGIEQGAVNAGSNQVDFALRHKDYSAFPEPCRATKKQGISGKLVTGDRMPVVCEGPGSCPSKSDSPLPGVRVVAISRSDGERFQTISGKNGEFSFKRLPAGTYTVFADYLDSETESRNYAGLSLDSTTVMCDGQTEIQLGFFTY